MFKKKIDFLKKRILNNTLVSIYNAGSGHPGGSLSCLDIILAIFIKKIKKNENQDRNRFVLSKGHAAPVLYAVAKEFGFLNNFELKNLRKLGSQTQGHPSTNHSSWVECNTGSLGQGFSYSIGMAKAYKMKKFKNKIFCVIGDGEMQEGQIWEGLMFANHHKLNNLCVFLDYNKLQSDDHNNNIMKLEPIINKIKSFGWSTISINGHNFSEIFNSLKKFEVSKKPLFIVANTIKGNGISYMNNKPLWHGSVKMSLNEITKAISEIKIKNKSIKII